MAITWISSHSTRTNGPYLPPSPASATCSTCTFRSASVCAPIARSTGFRSRRERRASTSRTSVPRWIWLPGWATTSILCTSAVERRRFSSTSSLKRLAKPATCSQSSMCRARRTQIISFPNMSRNSTVWCSDCPLASKVSTMDCLDKWTDMKNMAAPSRF